MSHDNYQTTLATLYGAKFKCNRYLTSQPAMQQSFALLTSYMEELLIAFNKIKCNNDTNIYSSLSACLRAYFPNHLALGSTSVVAGNTNNNAAGTESDIAYNSANSEAIYNYSTINNYSGGNGNGANDDTEQRIFLQQTFDLLSFCLTTIECVESQHKTLLHEVCFKHCYLFFHVALGLYGGRIRSDINDAIRTAADTFVKTRDLYRNIPSDSRDQILATAFTVIQIIYYGLVQIHDLNNPYVDLSACRLSLKVNNIRKALTNITQVLTTVSKSQKANAGNNSNNNNNNSTMNRHYSIRSG